MDSDGFFVDKNVLTGSKISKRSSTMRKGVKTYRRYIESKDQCISPRSFKKGQINSHTLTISKSPSLSKPTSPKTKNFCTEAK
jgi:hypothetical protein